MEAIRLVEDKILSVAEEVLKFLEDGSDYQSFESKLKEELDGLGCEILKAVLEGLDHKYRESQERKRHWKIVRKKDTKEILTPFGQLRYERSYYRHKESKEYSYLVDEQVGITPHMKVGATMKAEISDASSNMSYEKATQEVSRFNEKLKVSKQTVANNVKKFKVRELPASHQKRCVKELYIEADEDHLTISGGNGGQARLIYVHEGIKEHPRRHLINPRYFTTVNKKPEEFWLEVCDYLEAHYELSEIETIYISGDGGKWIRVGQEYIPGAKFVLDRFHLTKYICSATAHAAELSTPIYREIDKLNQKAVMKHLQEALKRADKPAREERIRKTIKYIYNNWGGIEASVKNPHVGCSAEGHVSHILAARLSSRPMAWSKQGAEKMASMRAVRANGESIKEHFLAAQESGVIEMSQEVKNELRKLKRKQVGKEHHNNVPIFNSVRNLTQTALKGLNEKTAI